MFLRTEGSPCLCASCTNPVFLVTREDGDGRDRIASALGRRTALETVVHKRHGDTEAFCVRKISVPLRLL